MKASAAQKAGSDRVRTDRGFRKTCTRGNFMPPKKRAG